MNCDCFCHSIGKEFCEACWQEHELEELAIYNKHTHTNDLYVENVIEYFKLSGKLFNNKIIH